MSADQVNADVLVVGAGISGLMAAAVLEARGKRVLVLDKNKRIGGRLATRRLGPGLADYGAQFFTVREPEFREIVDRWMDEQLVYVWSGGFSDGSLDAPTQEDGHPRYVAHGGLRALAERVAQDVSNIRLGTRIATATCGEGQWILQDQDGNLYQGNSLLLTAPVPLSMRILDEGAVMLARDDYALLASIEYAPCLTGLFWVEGVVTLPRPGAVQRRNANVSWIADNRQKGISPQATIVTVQANDQYSVQLWSAPDHRVLSALRTELQIFMRDEATVRDSQLVRWRFSRPLTIHDERCYVADNDPPLVFAGDAFGGPRIEGAVLSGLAAGKALLENQSRTG